MSESRTSAVMKLSWLPMVSKSKNCLLTCDVSSVEDSTDQKSEK